MGNPLTHETLLDELFFWILKYEFPQTIVTLLLGMLPDETYKVKRCYNFSIVTSHFVNLKKIEKFSDFLLISCQVNFYVSYHKKLIVYYINLKC